MLRILDRWLVGDSEMSLLELTSVLRGESLCSQQSECLFLRLQKALQGADDPREQQTDIRHSACLIPPESGKPESPDKSLRRCHSAQGPSSAPVRAVHMMVRPGLRATVIGWAFVALVGACFFRLEV